MCLISCVSHVADAQNKKESFFHLKDLSPGVFLHGRSFYFPTVFGPTGLTGWILDENLIVREIDPGSPADGVAKPNDVIQKMNGVPLGENPLKTFGNQIVVSEESGRLLLGIIRKGKEHQLILELRKIGRLGNDWPFGCEKSEQILADGAKYLASVQNPDGGFDNNTTIAWGLTGLTWLATNDPTYLENCRRLIHWYHNTNRVEDQDNPCWGWGYMGTFLGEYFLKTGDRSALPVCKSVAKRLADAQHYCGSWGHGPGIGHGYVQGGLLNAAGAGCWLALELFEECGVDCKETLGKARKFFMRFVDNGTLPYGDHHPEFNGSGNSKDALACLALFVKGETEAARLFGRICTDFPEHRVKGHTGGWPGFIWGNVAGLHNPHHPDYRRVLDHWNWFHHVSRRWDGAFHMPPDVTGQTYMFRGPVLNTGGGALVYGVPKKNLRIFGAPESVFGSAELSRALKRGLKLYQELKFAELRQKVQADTVLGKQLLDAASAKEKDVELSIRKAKQALEAGSPIMAKTIAMALSEMCDEQLPRCKELVKEAESDKYKSVLKAAEQYEKYRWTVNGLPECREAIKKIASSPSAGAYRKFASDILAIPAESSKWIPVGELLFRRYWEEKDNDPIAMAAVMGLARVKGGYWPHWHTLRMLRDQGLIKDEFVKEWQALIPASTVDGETHEVPKHYYPFHATKWENRRPVEYVPSPSPAWKDIGFDDSKWIKGVGQLSNDRKASLTIPRGTSRNYIRISFETDDTEFNEWKLYIKNYGHRSKAIVHLNGICIAWIDENKSEYISVELLPVVLQHLKKGRNVLAICSTATRVFDIGLYASRK